MNMTETTDTPAETYNMDNLPDTDALVQESSLLEELDDEDLALILEDQKGEAKDAVNAATRALLNDSEPLTDDKAARVAKVGNALRALSDALSPRVPYEHRCDEWQKESDQ